MQTLFSVSQLIEVEPALTKGGIRHVLFHRGPDLEAQGIVLRMGRKILINRERFITWLASDDSRRVAS